MHKPVHWDAITVPLDVQAFDVPAHSLRRWRGWRRLERGPLFECEMASEGSAEVQVDVVTPEVIRVRMGREISEERPSDLLVAGALQRPAPSYQVEEQEERLVLRTERLVLEFPRAPWGIRAFDRQAQGQASSREATPFFSQRYDDRAYGPFYEVPPTGFDENRDGRLTVRETVAVAPGESFYGFGEKFTPLDKWGQELVSWAVDSGNVSSHRSYKNIPFFMSSAGYGLFVHTSYPIVYRMGTESSISYSVHVNDSQLDYFLILGPGFAKILECYTELTGRAPVPPKWSFGFWISRAGYRNQGEVEAVIREMRDRDFPCDVISLDPWWMGQGAWCTYEWNGQAFPEPQAMIAGLRQQGVRTCLWITPYVAAGSDAHDEGLEGGYFLRRADGGMAPVVEAFAGSDLAAIDLTHPQAKAWFQGRLARLLEMGVAVFKTDFGEQAPADAVYYDGRSGLEMHNLYPLLYNRAVFELTERTFGRGLTWGRSGYAGSQRYPVQWGGDSYSSLDQMACQVRGLLSYGLSGVPFCGHDVGGFDYPPAAFDHAERNGSWFLHSEARDPVVYARWMQFGVFSSHVRAHGKQPREPWEYGAEVEAIARRFLKLRYRLLPYIYTQAVRSAETGLPVVRAMALEFQNDPACERLDLQYLFGDSFLVAPVVRRDHRCRVYLPAGDWVDYWSKEVVRGPQWLEVTVPIDRMPVWVRGGAIVAMGPEMDYVDQKPLDPLTLELYLPEGERATVVHDEDRPAIPAGFRSQAGQLEVQVGATPGEVEVVVYGVEVTAAAIHGLTVDIERWPGGQGVRFDGRGGARVAFEVG